MHLGEARGLPRPIRLEWGDSVTNGTGDGLMLAGRHDKASTPTTHLVAVGSAQVEASAKCVPGESPC